MTSCILCTSLWFSRLQRSYWSSWLSDDRVLVPSFRSVLVVSTDRLSMYSFGTVRCWPDPLEVSYSTYLRITTYDVSTKQIIRRNIIVVIRHIDYVKGRYIIICSRCTKHMVCPNTHHLQNDTFESKEEQKGVIFMCWIRRFITNRYDIQSHFRKGSW